MVERVVAAAGGLEGDPQLLLDPLLADEVVEALGAERALRLVLVGRKGRREELAHAAAPLSASLTRSSGGSSGSTSARARSASISV